MDYSQHLITDHTGETLPPQALEKMLFAPPYKPFCVTNAEGVFVELNVAYAQFYGYTREELMGQHFTVIVPEADRPLLRRIHDDFIAGAVEIPQEYSVRHRSGKLMRVRVWPLRLSHPSLPSFKMTILDPLPLDLDRASGKDHITLWGGANLHDGIPNSPWSQS